MCNLNDTRRAGGPFEVATELNWDEFRLVQAIADSHSLVGAAETLGLNHSTVFRRLASLEAGVGVRLFERSRSGYQPTAAGEEMIEVATRMGDAIMEFERRVAGRDVKPTGLLRLTAVEGMSSLVLAPIIAKFREINPGIQTELIVSGQDLSLSRRDADIALRATNGPSESLVGRKICTLRWGLYAPPPWASSSAEEVIAHAPFVGLTENQGPLRARRWYEKNVEPRRQAARVNSLPGAANLAAQGMGATILPCFIGASEPNLARLGDTLPDLDVDLWLLTHSDLRHSARVRAFMEFAGTELVKQRRRIEGEPG